MHYIVHIIVYIFTVLERTIVPNEICLDVDLRSLLEVLKPSLSGRVVFSQLVGEKFS